MLCSLAHHIVKWATKLGVKIQPRAVNAVKQFMTQPRATEALGEAFQALRRLLAGIEQPFALLLGRFRWAVHQSLAWLSGSHVGRHPFVL